MALQQIQKINAFVLNLVHYRVAGVAGSGIATFLSAIHVSLAAGHAATLSKNVSGPGINLFEFLSVTYLIIGSCFFLAFANSFIKKESIRLAVLLPLLIFITTHLGRVYYLRLISWPNWIREYSDVIFALSFLDILFIPLALWMWGNFFVRIYRFVRNEWSK
jgi:hypothetical protein